MKMFVTGASGMTGSYAPAVFDDFDLTLSDHAGSPVILDICDSAAVRDAFEAVRPDVVLHLAAATDVDRCEQEPERAYRHNALGTENVALACREFDVLLVYVSTAAVFSGDKPEPYVEYDDTNPISFYARSKLAGEHSVASMLERYYIVRAGWMVGGGARDKKFVGKLAQMMFEGHSEIKAVNDKIGSPTYAKDFLAGIKAILPTEHYGLFHMVNEGKCTRCDVAEAIKRGLGKTNVTIQPVSSDHFPLPAPRGASEALRNLKLELTGFHRMRPWQEAVDEYLVEELMPVFSD